LKRFVSAILLVLVCLTLPAIAIINRNPPVDDYITITSSQENPDTGGIDTTITAYGIKAKTMEEIFQFEYSAQYPLGFYDAITGRVYYTRRIDASGDYGDQIFVTDTKSLGETQLTDDLFAVNYIIPDGETVFFVARPHGSQVLKLGAIDLKTGMISYWGDDETGVQTVAIDKNRRKLVVATYSERERAYNVAHQEGPAGQDNMKMPTHTVYETDYSFENTVKLFEEALWIRMLMVHDNDIYALCDRKYNNSAESSILYRYNRDERTLYTSEWNTYRLQIGDANYSSDGQHIYSIASVEGQRGVYDFDLTTGEVRPIMLQNSNFINNIQVVIVPKIQSSS
jgi:hypothetical protein